MTDRSAGRGVLLTGGSGYVGGLIASTLLADEEVVGLIFGETRGLIEA